MRWSSTSAFLSHLCVRAPLGESHHRCEQTRVGPPLRIGLPKLRLEQPCQDALAHMHGPRQAGRTLHLPEVVLRKLARRAQPPIARPRQAQARCRSSSHPIIETSSSDRAGSITTLSTSCKSASTATISGAASPRSRSPDPAELKGMEERVPVHAVLMLDASRDKERPARGRDPDTMTGVGRH